MEITGVENFNLKLRGLRRNQISTHYFIYTSDRCNKVNTTKVILRMKHPRMQVPPTQFRKLGINLKIKFPENWTKTLVSSELAQFTESVPPFLKNVIAH